MHGDLDHHVDFYKSTAFTWWRGRWILLGNRGLHGSASLSPAKLGSGHVYMGVRVVYMELDGILHGEELSPM